MRIKRLIALLPLVAACTLSISGPAAADPDPMKLTVLQWNMAGAIDADDDEPNKPDNEGRLKPVGALVRAIEDTQPQIVSVNEICHSQYTHLVKELAARNIPMNANFQPTSAPGWNCNGVSYADWWAGNVILTIAPISDQKDYWFDGDEVDEDGNQDRGGACLTAEFSTRIRLCSFHLAKNATEEPPGPVAQATLFVDRFREDFVRYPHVLIGDFNASPDELRPLMYAPSLGGNGEFYESDMAAPNNGRPTQSTRKIDYIFATRNHFLPEFSTEIRDGGVCYEPHPCSDHRMLISQLTLAPDGGSSGGGGGYPPLPMPDPVDLPPAVSAGGDASGDEGAAIALRGSASDAESTSTVTWRAYPDSGVDAGARCSFADPHSLTTTVSCTDDGTYRVQLSASDGVNPAVSDGSFLRISNVAPKIGVTAPAAWAVYRAGQPVRVTAPFTDPGTNDTHTCSITWDDGTTDTAAAGQSACDRVHTFADAGMYTMRVTVTDDDGGSDTKTVMVVVYDPDAGSASGNGWLGTGTSQRAFAFTGSYPSSTATRPDASSTFSYQAAGLHLRADHAHEWMVITPDNKVAIKGEAELVPGRRVGYVLYSYDECTAAACADVSDRFRIVVWDISAGATPDGVPLLHDETPGGSFDIDQAGPRPLTAGTVTIARPSR